MQFLRLFEEPETFISPTQRLGPVFHFTDQEFNKFSDRPLSVFDSGDFGPGYYFTKIAHPDLAKQQGFWPRLLQGKFRITAYLHIANPFIDSVYNGGFAMQRPGDSVLAISEWRDLDSIKAECKKANNFLPAWDVAKEIMVKNASQIEVIHVEPSTVWPPTPA